MQWQHCMYCLLQPTINSGRLLYSLQIIDSDLNCLQGNVSLLSLEPNILKILPIIPSSTSQRIYPFISLPIIPILFFRLINVSGTYWHLGEQEFDMYRFCCRYIVSDTSKMVNESHTQIDSSLMLLFATDFNI